MKIENKNNMEKGWRFYAESEEAFEQGDFLISATTILSCVQDQSTKDFLLGCDRQTFEKIMTSSAEAGNEIHQACQDYLMGSPGNTKYKGAYENFIKLASSLNLKGVRMEVPVHSFKYGYAGTCDGLVNIGEQVAAIEIKTGKYKITAGWQLAAYFYALNDAGIQIDKMIGIHVHRNGEEFSKFMYQHTESCFKAFLAAFDVFRMVNFNKLKKLNWNKLLVSPLDIFYKEKYESNTKI